MARKKTKELPRAGKRDEMRLLEKELRRSGFRPLFWPTYGKRLVKAFTVLLLLAALSYGSIWLWKNHIRYYNVFSIKTLEYYSNGLMDEKMALRLMKFDKKSNMLTIDTEEEQHNLTSFSAVKSAYVKRKWPSTLIVEVDVRIPVAWLHCPGMGIRAYDSDNGMFVDADSCVFKGIEDLYDDYKNVPLLQIPTLPEGEIKQGEPQDALKTGVALIRLLKRGNKAGFPLPRVMKIRTEWAYDVEFDDGSKIWFGMYDQEEQVDKYYSIMEAAKLRGVKVKFANLLLKRNIVVDYEDGLEDIPLAEPDE